MMHLAVMLVGIPTPSPSASPIPVFGSNVIGFSFLLSTIVWAPVGWAFVLAVIPNPRRRNDRFFYGSSFWMMAAILALALVGYMQFQSFTSGVQYEEKLPWLPALGITYHLGADGISMVVVLLNAFVGLAAVLASSGIRARPREYFVLLLLAEGAINGVACARDLFVLVLFFGAASVPLALLVGGWGGPRRRLAGARLLGYWGVGTVALLLAVLTLGAAGGGQGFDLDVIGKLTLQPRTQVVVGVLVIVAIATRLPLFPLHGWAREALAEAPVGVVVLVAGAASRMGGYVLLRLLDATLHDATRLLSPFLAGLAGFTAIWVSLAAFRSRDVRLLGAYLAMVPGAITVLGAAGVTPLSLDGSAMSLFAGGIAAALVAGACAEVAERSFTRDLAQIGGLAGRAPRLAWIVVLAGLGIVGLPLTGTFVSDLLVFFGSFKGAPLGAFATVAGLLATSAAVGWMLHRVLFGAPHPEAPAVHDLPLAETWAIGLLAGALLWVGIFPSGPKLAGVPFFDPGMINVVNGTTTDLFSTYAPPPPPSERVGG
jgi:NADH-quinone oxidoreductase subunit M